MAFAGCLILKKEEFGTDDVFAEELVKRVAKKKKLRADVTAGGEEAGSPGIERRTSGVPFDILNGRMLTLAHTQDAGLLSSPCRLLLPSFSDSFSADLSDSLLASHCFLFFH